MSAVDAVLFFTLGLAVALVLWASRHEPPIA